MSDFEDLQEVAGSRAKNNFLARTAKNTLKIYGFLFLIGPLLAYPPIFGTMGWGVAGGVAGLLMSLTLAFAYTEIRFLIKGE